MLHDQFARSGIEAGGQHSKASTVDLRTVVHHAAFGITTQSEGVYVEPHRHAVIAQAFGRELHACLLQVGRLV